MKKIKNLKYEKPELVDFKWMSAMGTCDTHGNSDATGCTGNGGVAGGTCAVNGVVASGACGYQGSAVG